MDPTVLILLFGVVVVVLEIVINGDWGPLVLFIGGIVSITLARIGWDLWRGKL